MRFFPFGVDVEVLAAGEVTATDPYSGEDSHESDWDHPTVVVAYSGVPVMPTASPDAPTLDRPEYNAASLAAYLPYGAPVTTRHRLRVLSGPYAGTWLVAARPEQWEHPITGWEATCCVKISEVTG